MPKNLSHFRTQAAAAQALRCIYCQCPMWQGNHMEFSARFGLSAKQAKLFQCTAEHLRARRDGGNNTRANIAAACRHCNATRHSTLRPLSPAEYRQRVQRRVKQGGWLPGGLAAKMTNLLAPLSSPSAIRSEVPSKP